MVTLPDPMILKTGVGASLGRPRDPQYSFFHSGVLCSFTIIITMMKSISVAIICNSTIVFFSCPFWTVKGRLLEGRGRFLRSPPTLRLFCCSCSPRRGFTPAAVVGGYETWCSRLHNICWTMRISECRPPVIDGRLLRRRGVCSPLSGFVHSLMLFPQCLSLNLSLSA